jgi:hypothetical protein
VGYRRRGAPRRGRDASSAPPDERDARLDVAAAFHDRPRAAAAGGRCREPEGPALAVLHRDGHAQDAIDDLINHDRAGSSRRLPILTRIHQLPAPEHQKHENGLAVRVRAVAARIGPGRLVVHSPLRGARRVAIGPRPTDEPAEAAHGNPRRTHVEPTAEVVDARVGRHLDGVARLGLRGAVTLTRRLRCTRR